jgi:NTE family protein
VTRAVVLGGGGPLGIGWQAGLLVGLARAGIDLSSADAVVGTSAGSAVGFALSSGYDLTQAAALISAAIEAVPGAGKADPTVAATAALGLEQFVAMAGEAAADPDRAETIRAGLGRMAVEAPTISEELWVEMFSIFSGVTWPAAFSCTAVDTATGRFQIWDTDTGIDVQHALAASCAVPCIFPPVTISGRQWMDGGVRDMVNADIAAGHDLVLVVSCTLLELPPGITFPGIEAVLAGIRTRVEGLRDGGSKVETVVPGDEMLQISGWGLNLMDFTGAGAAYEAGLRQGAAEADRLAEFWAS